MKNSAHFCFAMLVLSVTVSIQTARPVEFIVGNEYYNKTYREYEEDGNRLVQQKGNLWSINAGVKYRFNDCHAAKLEGRYSHGKMDYTGSVQYITEDYIGDSASYGSAILKNTSRRAYDIRASYECTLPVNDRFSTTAGAGLGHRVLRDLSSRIDPNDYDRKNRTTYAQINTGVNIALPANFEISPRIVYNCAVKGRQCSYEPDQVEARIKQGDKQGIEAEVPISKKFANGSKISPAPFYRGRKAKESNLTVMEEYDSYRLGSIEPKNHAHEAGVRLQYSLWFNELK